MLKRLVLLILLIAAASFTHYNYGEAAQAVYIEPYQTIVTAYQAIPLDNITIAQSNQSSPSNRSSSTLTESSEENSTLLNMQVNLSADCNGIHAYVRYNNEPLEAADVSVYQIPRSPDYFELSSGRTDALGYFSFNTSESEVGMIVSKKYFQSQEMLFGIPSINCTPADSKAEANTTLPLANETGLALNETKDGTATNETKNTTANDSGNVPLQQGAVSQSSGQPPAGQGQTQAASSQFGDILFPVLLLVAAIAAYLVFGTGLEGASSGVNPGPLPKPAQNDTISSGVNPGPLPKPANKKGNVSSGVNPGPLP